MCTQIVAFRAFNESVLYRNVAVLSRTRTHFFFSFLKSTAPFVESIVPCLKSTVPFVKSTAPCLKSTVPFLKSTKCDKNTYNEAGTPDTIPEKKVLMNKDPLIFLIFNYEINANIAII